MENQQKLGCSRRLGEVEGILLERSKFDHSSCISPSSRLPKRLSTSQVDTQEQWKCLSSYSHLQLRQQGSYNQPIAASQPTSRLGESRLGTMGRMILPFFIEMHRPPLLPQKNYFIQDDIILLQLIFFHYWIYLCCRSKEAVTLQPSLQSSCQKMLTEQGSSEEEASLKAHRRNHRELCDVRREERVL